MRVILTLRLGLAGAWALREQRKGRGACWTPNLASLGGPLRRVGPRRVKVILTNLDLIYLL